jgi:hypothetical protein
MAHMVTLDHQRYLVGRSGEGRLETPPLSICYKTKVSAATVLLIVGLTLTAIGVPGLISAFAKTGIGVTFGDDALHIQFRTDDPRLAEYSAYTIVGISSVLMSTGILLGISCPNHDYNYRRVG